MKGSDFIFESVDLFVLNVDLNVLKINVLKI